MWVLGGSITRVTSTYRRRGHVALAQRRERLPKKA
jgi:hypothetical protein